MPAHGVQVYRQNIGSFNNTQQRAAIKPAPSSICERLGAVGNRQPASFNGTGSEIIDLPIRDLVACDADATHARPLAAQGVLQTAALLLYVQNGLGRTSGWTPFVEAAANSDELFIPASDPSSQAVATCLNGLGNRLVFAGAFGMIQQHPARAAAAATFAGLVLLGAGSAASCLRASGEDATNNSLPPGIIEAFKDIKLVDGETLDDAISAAIDECDEDSDCEVAVAALLKPYGGQVFRAQATGSPLGVHAAPVIPDQHWSELVHDVIKLYRDRHAHYFVATMENIAKAPENVERRLAVESMLEELGVAWEHQNFTRQVPPHFDAATPLVNGTNIFAKVTPGEVDANKPRVAIAARYDIGGNASGCAVVIDLIKHVLRKPPEYCEIDVIFFGEEQAGLNGSKAFAEKCLAQKDCPDLVITVEEAGEGTEIYAATSEYKHKGAYYADDHEAAGVPTPETLLETQLVNELEKAVRGKALKLEKSNTMRGDQLAFQFLGLSAMGLSLFKKGQSEKVSLTVDVLHEAVHKFEDTQKNFNPQDMAEAQAELDAAVNANDILKARHKLRTARIKDYYYRTAQARMHEAEAASRVAQGDGIESIDNIRPQQAFAFAKVLLKAIRGYGAAT